MKSLKIWVLTSLGATAVVMIVLLINGSIDFQSSQLLTAFGIALFYAGIFSLVNKWFFSWLGKEFSWEEHARTRFFLGAGGSIVLNTLTFAVCRFVVRVWFLNQIPAAEFLENERLSSYIFPLMLATIIALGFHVFYFYKTIQDEKIKQEKMIASQAEARFDALKSQLDPHFLFNSLNVLSSLIDEAPEKAQGFTVSLSEVYRYVLEQNKNRKIPVSREIDFAEIYMNLIKTRFENGIELNIEEALRMDEDEIIPLSLQVLLENAIKHNSASEENPLQVSIKKQSGSLTVRNSLSPKKQLTERPGFGLQNIKERYALLTDKEVQVKKTKTHFEVSIPVFSKKTTPSTH